MNLFDRFILFLYSLALTVLSAAAIAVCLQLVPYETVRFYTDAVYQAGGIRYIYLAAAAVLFLVSLKFLLQGFVRRTDRSAQTAVSQTSELGSMSISTETLNSITLKAARRIRGVKEVKPVIKTGETGTAVSLNVSVDGETPIPGIVEELQKSVRSQMESIVGIEVRDINVRITGVSQPNNTRVSRVE